LVTNAETGLKVRETVSDRLPNLVGQPNICCLATLAAKTEFKPLNNVLLQAMSCTKPSVLLSAIVGATKSCEACVVAWKGTIFMMPTLEKTVASMSRSEAKN
jgi:hypothetical protein